MAAKYVLGKSSAGFQFRLLGTNGKVIATSEVYNTKQAAKNGIDSVRRNAADAELVDESPGRGRPPAAAKKATGAPAKRTTRATKSVKPAKATSGAKTAKAGRPAKAASATKPERATKPRAKKATVRR